MLLFDTISKRVKASAALRRELAATVVTAASMAKASSDDAIDKTQSRTVVGAEVVGEFVVGAVVGSDVGPVVGTIHYVPGYGKFL